MPGAVTLNLTSGQHPVLAAVEECIGNGDAGGMLVNVRRSPSGVQDRRYRKTKEAPSGPARIASEQRLSVRRQVAVGKGGEFGSPFHLDPRRDAGANGIVSPTDDLGLETVAVAAELDGEPLERFPGSCGSTANIPFSAFKPEPKSPKNIPYSGAFPAATLVEPGDAVRRARRTGNLPTRSSR